MEDMKTSAPTMVSLTSVMTTNLGKNNVLEKWAKQWDALPPEEQQRRTEAMNKRIFEEEKRYLDQIKVSEKKGFNNLEGKDAYVTFESLTINDDNANPISRVKKWNPDMKKGIVIYGAVGTGKSTLGKCIINRFASSNYRCLFVSFGDAMQKVKDAINSKDTTPEIEINNLIEPNLLVLDDIGAEKTSEWDKEKLFHILEHRTRQEKHNIFTTNLSADQIEEVYGARIHDRLIEFCSWVKFKSKSFRKLNFENEI